MNITFRPNTDNSALNKQNRENKSSNIFFGENAEANKKLTAFAELTGNDFLIKQQEICSEMEKNLIKEESQNNPGILALIRTFVNQKRAQIITLEDICPGLGFGQLEMDTYAKEIEDIEKQLESTDKKKPKSKKRDHNSSNQPPFDENSRLLNGKLWRSIILEELSEDLKPYEDDEIEDQCGCKVGNESPKKAVLKEFKHSEDSPKGFCDVAGHEDIKKELTKKIVLPMNDINVINSYKDYNIKPYSSYMFYGPPGCGKTLLVEALAKEANIPLFKLNIAEVGSIYIHETSIKIQRAFEQVEEKVKKTNKPCILFLDEIESLTPQRSSLDGGNDQKAEEVDTFLRLLNDAKKKKIIVIAATNYIEKVDNAVKRPGRFDNKLNIKLPDVEGRKTYLKLNLTKNKMAADILNNDSHLNKIAKATEGYSYSDFDPVLENASMKALDRKDFIKLEDILSSIEEFKKRKLEENKGSIYDLHSPNPPEILYT